MGTRADFYVGRGQGAEWLGSIAYDGYPDGVPGSICDKKTEPEYRAAVETLLIENEDATRPVDGWPWPWSDSHTTDYAYAFDDGQVWVCSFGRYWFEADRKDPGHNGDEKKTVFPDMKARSRLAAPGSLRSGIMTFRRM